MNGTVTLGNPAPVTGAIIVVQSSDAACADSAGYDRGRAELADVYAYDVAGGGGAHGDDYGELRGVVTDGLR